MERRGRWIAGGLVALALGLRLYGIDWGLPQVYEEAYPLKRAWPMWGWGPNNSLDLNPHFFNYPSFYFYVQFIAQGLLHAVLRVFGEVESTLDFRTLFVLDKTPFYVLGRSITTLFAAGTVLVTYLVGRRVSGVAAGAVAALLVATNHVHIAKSQVIEVDVPLTFFVMLTGLFAIGILREPRTRNYVLAGIFAGLATSTKYSGALLPLGIVLAHVVAVRRAAAAAGDRGAKPAERRGGRRSARPGPGAPASRAQILVLAVLTVVAAFVASRDPSVRTLLIVALSYAFVASSWRSLLSKRLLLAGLASLAALLSTSPFIVLDREAFWLGFNYERMHMRLGHFGQDEAAAIVFYAKVLTDSLLGWPLALASGAGFVYVVLVRRRAWGLVLAIFPVVYGALISSFSMRAERYILPLMPIACLLASAAAADILARVRLPRRWMPSAALALFSLVLALPSLAGYQRSLARLRGDTRTLARQWIEANVPPGSYIASEAYGPQPLSALDLAEVELEVRQRILEHADTKLYAMAPIPMIQVRPETMSIFYDLGLYDELADYIVTSSSVSSRYRRNPTQFAKQVAFYDGLDARYELVREFGPEDASGPRLKIYRNPRQTRHFAARDSVPSPATQPRLQELLRGTVSVHYQRLGVNLETFGFTLAAAEAYRIAWTYSGIHPNFMRDVALGAIRCYLRVNRPSEAAAMLDEAERAAENPADKEYWHQLRRQLFAG